MVIGSGVHWDGLTSGAQAGSRASMFLWLGNVGGFRHGIFHGPRDDKRRRLCLVVSQGGSLISSSMAVAATREEDHKRCIEQGQCCHSSSPSLRMCMRAPRHLNCTPKLI